MLTYGELFEEVSEAARKVFENLNKARYTGDITRRTKLYEDGLDLDDMAVWELAIYLEDISQRHNGTRMSITDPDSRQWETIGDTMDYMAGKLNVAPEAGAEKKD